MSIDGVYCDWCSNHCKIGDIALTCPKPKTSSPTLISVSSTGTVKKTVDGKVSYKPAYVPTDTSQIV